ncbi:MAG: DUF5317 domain-containing protein, partial [Chloroflexota bacterium]|nr:DUF5317 domain-containing protein [Chloroflexota bacterium]
MSAKEPARPCRVAPPLRSAWLVFLVLAAQSLAIVVLKESHLGAAKSVLVASYLVLLLALVRDLRRPAIALIFVGASLNFAVISANGGLMPVSPETLSRIAPSVNGRPISPGGPRTFDKDTLREADNTRLRWLSDTLVFPRPLRAVPVAFSVGDVLIALGI